MKIKHTILALVLFISNTWAYAHCPSSYKEEKVCFMLDQNVIYIYDHKLEHNGPYKDFAKAALTEVKSPKGDVLPFKKIARGIYKIESTENQKKLTLTMALDKKKSEITLSHE